MLAGNLSRSNSDRISIPYFCRKFNYSAMIADFFVVELQYILDKENKKVEGESLHRVSLSCNTKQTHKGGSIPHE